MQENKRLGVGRYEMYEKKYAEWMGPSSKIGV